jgi:hypothetical protein
MKIKDLDRKQIYDLRGITHEQQVELSKWMAENTPWPNDMCLKWIKETTTLSYGPVNWLRGTCEHERCTTHISTLFEEPSYEEQLIEAVKRVEELKRKINEPKVGEWMFMKGRGFKIVQHEKQASGLKNQGWQKVTDPFTLETLNNYNK